LSSFKARNEQTPKEYLSVFRGFAKQSRRRKSAILRQLCVFHHQASTWSMSEEASSAEACLAARLEGGLSFSCNVMADEALGPIWKALLLAIKVLDFKIGPRGRGLLLELMGPQRTEFSIRISENTVVALIDALYRTFTKASHRKQYQNLVGQAALVSSSSVGQTRRGVALPGNLGKAVT
jgi:hypothetical protein